MTWQTKLGTIIGAPIGITVNFTLQIAGAAAVAWGASEVSGLRYEENKEAWQVTAFVIAGVGLFAHVCNHYYYPQQPQPHTGFFSSLTHSVAAPYTAIKTEVRGEYSPFANM